MSKGKELLYSFNRSFEKIKSPLFWDLQIPKEKTDILLSVAPAHYKVTKGRCQQSILSVVSDRELLKVKFSTCYSSIDQKLG